MNKGEILSSLDQLQAGGSTNGGAGIKLAYDVAVQNFIAGGTNRVILATDGDFNVGVTSDGDLVKLIEQKRQSGVFLSVLGLGEGNLQDKKMESLADKGNGNYSYIDTPKEARKVLVEQVAGTLVTVAKDVKIQVEFNPTKVASYRLIGYENRLLANADFQDDAKDAGEIGAGHSVTAFYELVPPGKEATIPGGAARRLPEISAENRDIRRPQKIPRKRRAVDGQAAIQGARRGRELGSESGGDRPGQGLRRRLARLRFGAAVAAFGMLLRDSPYKGNASYAGVLELAGASEGDDPSGYRREFLDLVRKAQSIGGK